MKTYEEWKGSLCEYLQVGDQVDEGIYNHFVNALRVTISSMADTIKQDLYKILNEDMDDLRVELDVAKNSIEKKQRS